MGQLTYLKDLDDRKNEWSIAVRAVRVYDVPARDGRGNTMEIIFHDAKGSSIHAQVKRPEMKKFKPKIKEGLVCALRNFIVNKNYHSYKTTDHPFILGFYKNTLWMDINSYPFPTFKYNMCPFNRLVEPLEQNLLIDVIGKIVGRTGIQNRMVQGSPQKTMDLTLENGSGRRLRCTLWGDYIKMFNNSIGEGITDPILIVQFARPKEYMKEISISTSFHVTKLILDNESEEAKEFLKTFKNRDDDALSSSTLTLTQSSEVIEDSNANIRVSSIREILNETEDGYVWVLADIVAIENYKDWNYLGCCNKSCNCKVEKVGDGFRCDGCAPTNPFGKYKYKVTVCLKDRSGNATFTLWDRECKDMMGVPASKLRDVMIMRTGDARDFPEELETEILKQSGLFKTVLRNASIYTKYQRERTFGVMAMITDPKTVALYKPPAAPKEDLNDWEGYDFSGLDKEMIGSNEETPQKKWKGKEKMEGYIMDEDECFLGDMGSSTKPQKKLKIGGS